MDNTLRLHQLSSGLRAFAKVAICCSIVLSVAADLGLLTLDNVAWLAVFNVGLVIGLIAYCVGLALEYQVRARSQHRDDAGGAATL